MLVFDRMGVMPTSPVDIPCPHYSNTLARGTLKSDHYSITLKVEGAKSRRFVDIDGIQCDTIQTLLRIAPLLRTELLLLAKAVNFLAQGKLFHVIEEPDTFRRRYDELLKDEYDMDICGGLGAYGRFNIDEIALPTIKDNTLTFYAVNDKGVPHCVTYPLDAAKPIRYNTLRSSM